MTTSSRHAGALRMGARSSAPSGLPLRLRGRRRHSYDRSGVDARATTEELPVGGTRDRLRPRFRVAHVTSATFVRKTGQARMCRP
jgi:hypothetical protein